MKQAVHYWQGPCVCWLCGYGWRGVCEIPAGSRLPTQKLRCPKCGTKAGSPTLECEMCHECGRRYLSVYCVPASLWARVTDLPDGAGLLCLRCFDTAARRQGIVLFWQACEGEFPSPDTLEVGP